MKDKLIVCMDGPSGSGKSTVSVRLAYRLGIPCIDTGAMYRQVALEVLNRGISLEDASRIAALAEKFAFRFGFDGEAAFAEVRQNGSPQFVRIGNEIRTPEVSMAASTIAKHGELRKVLVKKQQEIGLSLGGVVEGRDAGTVIFPDSRFKFFLNAGAEERAKRRFEELKSRLGASAPVYESVLEEMRLRDNQDQNRAVAPLKAAADAVMVDTSSRGLDEVVDYLIEQIRKA